MKIPEKRLTVSGYKINPICFICLETHSREATDQLISGRRSPICASCYPLFRKATNLLAAAKTRAKKKNLLFDLDLDWIIKRLKEPCPKTNANFQFYNNGKNYKDRHPLTPSIDKINPFGDYSKDNCQIVIWWYNVSKQTFDEEYLYHLCSLVVNTYEMKNAPLVKVEDWINQRII